MKLQFLLLSLVLFLFVDEINAQEENKKKMLEKAPENWFNLDAKKDNIKGVSTEKAYLELLKNKKSKKVIVAILDSGVEIDHEDLKDKIWVNRDEVAGNSVDDDKNGYIDDVYGWNFIGGKDGKQVHYDTWEMARLYKKYSAQFKGKDTLELKGKDKKDFALFKDVKAKFEKERKYAERTIEYIKKQKAAFIEKDELLKKHLNKEEYNVEDLKVVDAKGDSAVIKAVKLMSRYKKYNYTAKSFDGGIKHFEIMTKYKLNPDFDPRNIVGDNFEDKSEKYYGNNEVEGPDAFHGTHVAGIVGASRNNEKGMKGIAENVELMVVRVVPAGDERDKDVANAVYYAVDNGAQIINMSFGKAYSPHKGIVDKAFKYAAKKGVLIVHAAGNDSENSDEIDNFPNRRYLKAKKECKTWIEVGASSWGEGKRFIGGFTNYGKQNVDVFAPGVDVYSAIPDGKYGNASGTSMAAPVFSGVAALVWSYYPELTALQLKDILLKSAVKYKGTEVPVPGSKDKKVDFTQLSRTGGIVNVYEALLLAEKMTKK